jgi:hypothetical protein
MPVMSAFFIREVSSFKWSDSSEEEFTAKAQRSPRDAEEELGVICYGLLGEVNIEEEVSGHWSAVIG